MDIGAPSGRVIGGRCIEVFTSWLSVRRTHTCAFQFSITDTAHYQFLQAMSSFVLFFVYVIICPIARDFRPVNKNLHLCKI